MVECTNKYFIYNGRIYNCDMFEQLVQLTGTTIYEVIRVIDGVPLFIEQHLSRLINSSKLSKVDINYSNDEIVHAIALLIKENKIDEGNIKIIFNNEKKAFCAYFIKHKYPSKEMYDEGVETILVNCERENPNVKAVNSNFRENVDAKILKANVFEAILIDKNGFVTEGSKSNIFMIDNETIITAPLKDVLPGVTRDRVINIAHKLEFDFCEKNVHFEDIFKMDAVFITGTSPKILPVSMIDKKTINSTKNAILKRLILDYNLIIHDYVRINLNSIQ